MAGEHTDELTDESAMELPTQPWHPRTLDSETFWQLRDGPKTSDELASGSITCGLRDQVGRLKPPPRTGAGSNSGHAKAVLYLWGDERRAVRKFIEINIGYVENVVKSGHGGNNALQHGWGEGLYQLFVEEWQMRRASNG